MKTSMIEIEIKGLTGSGKTWAAEKIKEALDGAPCSVVCPDEEGLGGDKPSRDTIIVIRETNIPLPRKDKDQ